LRLGGFFSFPYIPFFGVSVSAYFQGAKSRKLVSGRVFLFLVFPVPKQPNPGQIRSLPKTEKISFLGGGFKYFLFSPLPGEDSHVD